MAKDVKFNIKLSIDGKEQIVTASTNVKKFAEELAIAQTKGNKLRDQLIKFNGIATSFQNLASGLQQLTGAAQTYIDANKIQAEAETKLETVMRQRMAATEEDIQGIKELASAQQALGVTGYNVYKVNMGNETWEVKMEIFRNRSETLYVAKKRG